MLAVLPTNYGLSRDSRLAMQVMRRCVGVASQRKNVFFGLMLVATLPMRRREENSRPRVNQDGP
jgi:hypothetical protein